VSLTSLAACSFVETEIDHELLLVGAGSLKGFKHTNELRVMNYREAMASDPVKWKDRQFGKSI
jgi:hypothetical protein